MVFSPHLVVPSAVVNAAIRGMHLVTITQYLSGVGLVALLYDHFLTLSDEINLIRTTPRSFLKWVFLTNHYLVEVCLIAVANEMSGFSGLLRDDHRCQIFISAVACYAVISTFVANFLGFLRVITLWGKSHRIVIGLSIALAMSFLTSMASMVASVIFLEPTIRYDLTIRHCFTAMGPSRPYYVVLWVCPLVFDITVLAFIVYNALSNPRDLKTSLRRVLYRDGILFFLLVTLIRVLNLVFIITAEPELSGLPLYLSWAIITLACRRFLINIHSCKQEAAYYDDLHASRHSLTETDSESAIELHSCETSCH